MLRSISLTLGFVVVWTLAVIGVVLVEAAWFAEPDIVRGDFSSIKRHLDSTLQEAASSRKLGAAAMSLIQNGEIVFDRAYGYADADASTPVNVEQTLFQVGSVSKAVTAFGVMKLVQENKLSLDEPVIDRLKWWRFAGSDERRNKITIRQLLSHTAGVADPDGYIGFAPGGQVESVDDYLGGVRITRDPGTAFMYGNAATAVLQVLIEDITGETFPEYMADSVLRPLGMTNSTFDFEMASGRLAPAFDSSVDPQPARRHSIPGAVALYTSGRDLGRFAQALGGANAVLNEGSMQSMTRPVAETGGSWGLGLALFAENDAGGHVLGHDGGAQPSWGAMVRFNPATRNGMVIVISGGRGAANQLSHDWVYWETGKLTFEARRQVVYGRVRTAALLIGLGIVLICFLGIVRHRTASSIKPQS